jgi:hypothetical protein
MKHMPDYPLFKLVSNLYEVVPSVLGKTGKVDGCDGLPGCACTGEPERWGLKQ